MPERVRVVHERDVAPVPTPQGGITKFVCGNMSKGGFPTDNLALLVATIPPGTNDGLHKHSVEEAIYVIRGRGNTRISETEYALQPGTFVYFGPGIPHVSTNTGQEPLEILVAFGASEYETTELE